MPSVGVRGKYKEWFGTKLRREVLPLETCSTPRSPPREQMGAILLSIHGVPGL